MVLSEKGDADPALTPGNASIKSTPSVKSKKEVELTPVQEAAALEKPGEPQQDVVDHPKGLKLATVVVALCLAVFLVALVRSLAFRFHLWSSGHAHALSGQYHHCYRYPSHIG